MVESNWEARKEVSAYHFDNKIVDPRWDCVVGLGRINVECADEVAQVIESAKPVTWRTRGRTSNSRPEEEYAQEEFDLAAAGANVDLKIANFEYNLTPKFQQICELIGLEDREDRVHVQWPGQVFNLHIDKLEKFNEAQPNKIMRVMIQLTDWEPGHFAAYGNFLHTHWRKGDVFTFAWKHVPHASANASLIPRVSLVTTGTVGAKTRQFLSTAKNTNEINL
jgi:hypothetical protein